MPVGKLLVQLGFVSEATLRDALSEKLGLQSVDLARIIVDPAALKHLPREMARRNRMFPVALDRQQRKFIVALADTNNIVAIDQLRAHLKGDYEIELRLAAIPRSSARSSITTATNSRSTASSRRSRPARSTTPRSPRATSTRSRWCA